MIGMRTILEVADNSGARRLSCILPRGGDLGLRAGLGDVVTAAVKEAAPDSAIKKGKVVRCVIVRMRKETRRKDGTYIRFDSNAAVLINDVGEPVGQKISGSIEQAQVWLKAPRADCQAVSVDASTIAEGNGVDQRRCRYGEVALHGSPLCVIGIGVARTQCAAASA